MPIASPLAALCLFWVLILPALAQSQGNGPPDLDRPVVSCANWKPAWATTPLPNGRADPYLLVPLDAKTFRGCGLAPVLSASGLPAVQLYVVDPAGSLQPVPVASENAGLPAPFPPTARVFWQPPASPFPRGSHMAVFLLVRQTASGGQAWLRYDMPGGIPTIDRSPLGPVAVSGSANYIPHEQLLNGPTASAYHGFVRIVLPSLSANPASNQVYLRSDNLLSTQKLDDAAGYSLAFGVQHNLPSPVLHVAPNESAEIWTRSNQAATDQSAGVALGTQVLGRNWWRPVGDRLLYPALTPRFQLYPVSFAYLYRRDLRLDPGFTERSYYDPSAEVYLAPIFIGVGRGRTATLLGTPNLSVDFRGWWVTGLGAEYRYVVRLQVPVRIWILQAVGISYFQGADENAYFRYSNGVGFDAVVIRGKLF